MVKNGHDLLVHETPKICCILRMSKKIKLIFLMLNADSDATMFVRLISCSLTFKHRRSTAVALLVSSRLFISNTTCPSIHFFQSCFSSAITASFVDGFRHSFASISYHIQSIMSCIHFAIVTKTMRTFTF